MAIWLQIALVLNVACWAFFFVLLSRRRWNWAALTVSIFHMLYAGIISVAPFRSLLDPNYMGLGLGFLRFEGQAAALPAALILGWALAAAWIAVLKMRGRWMRLIAAGDIFFALNMGGSILLDDAHEWKFQLGEHLSITGVAGLLVLLGFFTVPFVVSAIWAIKRAGSGGTTTPLAHHAQDNHGTLEKKAKKEDGFKYSQRPT
jgi:hypothetical protein